MSTVVDERVTHDEMLGVDDVAGLLHVSVATVRRMIAAGELPALQLAGQPGRPLRVRRQELEQLIHAWATR
ncbi:MAG: helix-turn-helix domain-containing protein [Candidatus Dormibacteria bacterium]